MQRHDLAVKLYPLLGIRIEKYCDMVVNALNLQLRDTVAELGCGTGLNFQRALEKIGTNEKLIVDITDKMLEEASKRIQKQGWSNAELVHSDIAEYEFPKEVGCIFATGALQYSLEHEQIVKRGYDGSQLKNILKRLHLRKVGGVFLYLSVGVKT
jgi:demethylmenaquinone methyltransferase/2-methoxy-6-polyprenyl-1,4-benzoquinol methylase